MKILVWGAGVIGTLYAGRLQHAGHQVSVLARSSRLADIRRHGLILQDVESGAQLATRVDIVEQLSAEEVYDMALIAVRWGQLDEIMPGLIANNKIPAVVFMLNNPLGSAALVEALGADRVVLGFPGAGGTLEGHTVHYALIAQQPTTIGEPGGHLTTRLRALAEALRASGFKTRMDSDMNSWLLCHAFFVSAVSGAIYLAGGSCEQLSHSQTLLNLMARGVREGFHAARLRNYAVRPSPLKVLFSWLPRPVAVYYWRRFFSNPMSEYVFARHILHASVEMRALAAECQMLVDKSGIAAPALHQLYRAIDDFVAVK
jgi:2-dehydropantoate 2-reductase